MRVSTPATRPSTRSSREFEVPCCRVVKNFPVQSTTQSPVIARIEGKMPATAKPTARVSSMS